MHEINHPSYLLFILKQLDLSFSGDLRNDLYLTLVRGEFERGSKTAGKNIEVRVVVLDSEGNIQVIINIEVRVVVLYNEGSIQVIIEISCMGSEIQLQFIYFV